MPLLAPESSPTDGEIPGREKRNTTLSTKLTDTEFTEVETYCQARQVAPGEWLREVVFREVRGDTNHTKRDELILSELDLMLSEVVGIRIGIINLLRPRNAEEGPLTPEVYDAILKKIKVAKNQVTQQLLAQLKANNEHPVG
jgi:hypothetical protein